MLLSGAAEFVEEGADANDTVLLLTRQSNGRSSHWRASSVNQAIVRAGVLLIGAAEFVEERVGTIDTVLSLVRPATAVTVIMITVGLASELRGHRVTGKPRQSNGRSPMRACCSVERRSSSRRELVRTILSCRWCDPQQQ